MTAFAIKLIALLTMITDHTAAVFSESVAEPLLSYQAVGLMRYVGRIAFPLYAFLLVEGFRHTRSRSKYALRLLGLGVLSQIPYAFTLNGWVAFTDMPWWRRVCDLNILFTLALGVLLLTCLDTKRFDKAFGSWGVAAALAALSAGFYLSGVPFLTLVLAVAAVLVVAARFAGRLRYAAGQAARLALFGFVLFWCLKRNIPLPGGESIHFSFDYDIFALVLFAALYWAKTPLRSALAIAAWGLWCYFGDWGAVLFVAGSAVCAALYNGQKGINDHRLFYWAYPAHLLMLWGAMTLLT